MELTELKNRILQAYKGNPFMKCQIMSRIEQDKSIFPFNEYELLLATFLAKGNITYETYLEIRGEYIAKNPNLWIFEISAPRGFGESFAQTYLLGKCSKLQPASKQLDKNYHGQYDLWLDGIRIEVKASRVCDSRSDEPLYKKALSYNTQCPFLMNFQQLKPQCCDVFVWMAVYRDKISIWVMNSKEVMEHKDYSKGQHRGNNGNEGQLHITEKTLNH
ncbi:MAG: hypothetical protein NC038_02845 [Paludibacter sp.]|nr:hypothetical protein [Bacteroidales bacterium]MCM1069015.1 hypothetical protein [Prevotella sp.]MCM1353678.1 hypothetical protein [Bacteroides sp.]MCM1441973.1 hypothetical protein [Muribaculum sp.]MCM1481571.1 hypothetical protein [Paludibacter sp.]